MRKFILFCLFLSLILLVNNNFVLADDLPTKEPFIEKGVVTKVLSEKHDKDLEEVFKSEQIIQVLNIKILTGKLRNQEVRIKNYLTSNPEYDIKIKLGDRVIIEKDFEIDDDNEYYQSKQKDEDNNQYESDDSINIAAKDNSPIILILSGLFLLLLILSGGHAGLKTIAILAFAGFFTTFALIPAIIANTAIFPISIGIALASCFFGVFLLNGFNIKSLCAAIGASLSFVTAGLLALFITNLTSVSNITTQAGLILMNEYPELNFKAILISAIILSILGALIHIGITVANRIAEKQSLNQDYGFKELFKEGFMAGKEIINSIILVIFFIYLGGALPILLLSLIIPFIKFINLGLVVTSLSSAIICVTAIILCSPLTAAITALTLTKFVKKQNPEA